uniref:Uncharacterized protein n=1 Tax=Kwoniella bestiolae CBS 10118 TaxID=1296100 RepID=A0A1B9G8R8_9TREE|nr:hypothetical protein I302_02270 [Kwoniella bestiolae CBS 10118]OCF27428.1 hypothetical protein I302_02270 [Kwoniella bestiolae CBS 10118]
MDQATMTPYKFLNSTEELTDKFIDIQVEGNDIRSEEDSNKLIRCLHRPIFTHLTRHRDPVRLDLEGEQYLPLPALGPSNRPYTPSSDSQAFKNLNDISKGILSDLFEDAEENGESYSVVSIAENPQKTSVTWSLRRAPIGSNEFPDAMAKYRFMGVKNQFVDRPMGELLDEADITPIAFQFEKDVPKMGLAKLSYAAVSSEGPRKTKAWSPNMPQVGSPSVLLIVFNLTITT